MNIAQLYLPSIVRTPFPPLSGALAGVAYEASYRVASASAKSSATGARSPAEKVCPHQLRPSTGIARLREPEHPFSFFRGARRR
jgi:hypothetical protein